MSRSSVGKILSHSAENFHWGILYYWSIFGYRKSWDNKGGGEYQDIPSKIFFLTVPIIFVGEFLFFALITGTEKVWIRGGGVSRYSVENFLFHSGYNFRRGILYFYSIFGYRKSLDKRWGECQDLPSKKFCLTVPKIFVG